MPPDLSISQLLSEYFLRYGYHGFPVAQNGKVSGVISLEDVQPIPEDQRSAITVEQTMQPLSDRTTIAPQVPLTNALSKMAHEGSGRLLVMQDATLQGMITKTGLLRFLEIKRIVEVD